ncbi:CDP-alcohol phosphatidyltransferase family protein [Xanthomonas euvesicatoria pv. eucalypti]|uniref:CDP-alcohol phosphatidyltransferase family protein n=1 Tax=Xanthomonas euvesicatoria TaxID=456327 RepID=UPI0026E47595|nr:CDP-alcohol phosphatidyltransferase family protein [Xanthomonas euvesicatoria]MDO7934199.1 CDP-alcohol phosphatidyltransferase family protein [Xanthomonas euvesicatoria pv. eucalypti]MDO7936355.1 CDP-alcohol phosphatidyltransferase family protein [Xanthomonas euvesicatoria pv. eucalypti]MDO7942563.1 CDP-alcohol phosphatidyltransferase family protein [Xanthomonas euvesicatoria pv. eucalypti]MDO7946823.1 CDP-alcohol phosphatidyltransferase family protein [Xanthomonas euvesicatoria pv. eucalypt
MQHGQRQRQLLWARVLRGLGATPNGVSWVGIACAALAGLMFYIGLSAPAREGAMPLLLAVLGLQGRLWCNRMDGVLARQARMVSRAGEVYNDAPDRLSDVLVCVGLGYGLQAGLPWAAQLGWAAALCCVTTAYVRMLGLACGTPEPRQGPMSRVQRMQWLSLAGALALPLQWMGQPRLAAWLLVGALAVLIAGALLTVAVRLRTIVRTLEQK